MKHATCVSCMKPSGKRGRSVRSVWRADSTSLSPGRPSRLKKPPGIFPAAYIFSRYSTVRGKKGRWVGESCAVAAQSIPVSPYCR